MRVVRAVLGPGLPSLRAVVLGVSCGRLEPGVTGRRRRVLAGAGDRDFKPENIGERGPSKRA